MKRRLFSLLLTGAMLLSMCPPGFALEPDSGGLCPHHTEHSFEVCGYIEAVEGQPCGHVHDGDCGFAEAVPEVLCDMDCGETGEDGQIVHAGGCAYAPAVEGVPCQHEHNNECGYVPADPGLPCGYVCRICPVQALIDALPALEDITADNRAEVEAQLTAIDGARVELMDEEAGELDTSRYQAVVSALAALDGQTGANVPMLADDPAEQFDGTLTPGGTYWFDLSGAGIPGNVNTGNKDGAATIPDPTLHWVPFTYVGTINAYVLNKNSSGQLDASQSASETTDPGGQYGYTYDHSLFIADYNVTHYVLWKNLNGKRMIFGTPYTSSGVNYTMRAPSLGSGYTNTADGSHVAPESNEWDVILNKDDGYIQNWSNIYSWGQDTVSNKWNRAARGHYSARFSNYYDSDTNLGVTLGFRPVLELPAPGTLTDDSLKVVTLNLDGGKAGTRATKQGGPVNIVVKSGADFTAPSGKGLTAPSGKVFSGWKGSNGQTYAEGTSVPSSETSLTAHWKTTPTVTVTAATNLTYNSQSQELIAKGSTTGGELQYSLSENDSYSTTIPTRTNAGDYKVWYKVVGNDSYTDVAAQSIEVTIAPKSITGATIELGDSLTYTGQPQTQTVKLVTIDGLTATYIVTGNRGIDAKDYTLTVTGRGNFTGNQTAKFTIAKATPTPDIPTGLTATYGQTLADVSLLSGWAWDAPTTFVGNVGSNTFPATFTPDDTENYKTVPKSLTVTVSAAPRTITVTGQADGPTQVTLNDAVIEPDGTGGTVTYGKNTTNMAPGSWQSEKEFTALTANTTYYFFAKVEANGNYAEAVSEGTEITTPAKAVSSIQITDQPSNLAYTSGQALDLSGLSVTVSYDDGTNETIPWSSGKLTASPAAGTVLTVTEYNGKTVAISYGGKTVETATLTVEKGEQSALSIAGAPDPIYNGGSFILTVSGGSGAGAVTWEIVSGPATVEGNGTVTVKGTGEIQIRAVKDADGNYNQAETSITLNAVTRPTPPPGKYFVTVNGGTGGGSYAAGDTVTITATVPDGQRFTGWTVNTGGVTLANASNASFTMPAQAVTVTANFENIPTGGGGGGDGSYTPPTYPPTVERPSEGGGTATVSPSNPERGDTVTVTPKPDAGYEVDKVTITDRNGNPVEVTLKPDGTYTFKQPNGKVKIEVTYKPVERPWNNPFTDVSEGDWYYEAVRFVHERGLMNGYSDGRFGPNDNLSRAQLAQILFNREGRPVVNYLLDFSDVAGEAWYTEAIRWATSQGIVGGYGNGTFGPNDPITREQLAVMLWRYSGSPAATERELHFTDTDEISGFALEAMRWAVENGILNGYGDGRLGPQGQATRAQVAQMLKNFIENQEENT